MEMHIVHRNMEYSNFSQALEYEDGVVVVATFFQVSFRLTFLDRVSSSRLAFHFCNHVCFQLRDEQNELLQPFISKLPDVRWAYAKKSVNISISLSAMLPLNTDVFYTYKGSLTTPPCNEVVTWIIFSTPVPISFNQVWRQSLLALSKISAWIIDVFFLQSIFR